MPVKEIAFEVENLQVVSEKVNSLQNALFTAIYRGDFAPSEYEWAFITLGDLTFALKNQLHKVQEELFQIVRVEKEEVT